MTTTALNLIQIYSDRRGATLVAQACERLRRHSGLPDSHETGWNTELLRSSKLRSMAAREAAQADLVIMALDEGIELSIEIQEWLTLWRRRIRSKRSRLIVFLRCESLASQRPVETALHSFAKAAKLDFFCYSRVDLKALRGTESIQTFPAHLV
jgi:hypothetical protein